jgi:hypothetical protein
MARQRPSKQLETIKKQQEALSKKFREIKTKARNELKEEEKRINELVGAVIRKQLAAEPSSAFALSLRECLDKGLTGANEREALKLSTLPRTPKNRKTPKTPQEPAKGNVTPHPAALASTPFGLSFLSRDKEG